MLAIILAAGLGKRLRPLTDNIPKALIKLKGNVRVIDVICCNLLSAGVKDITIVVGHASEVLKKYISENPMYAKFDLIQYVMNEEFEKTNTAVSLYIALKNLVKVEDIIVVNGDIVFDYRILEKLVHAPGTAIVVDNFKTLTKESFKVRIEGNVIIGMGKDIDIESSSGEYIGLAKICREDVELATEILRQIVDKDRNAYYDFLFQWLSRIKGLSFVFTDGLPWTEIDFIEDLEYAEKLIAGNVVHFGSFCMNV